MLLVAPYCGISVTASARHWKKRVDGIAIGQEVLGGCTGPVLYYQYYRYEYSTSLVPGPWRERESRAPRSIYPGKKRKVVRRLIKESTVMPPLLET